MLNVGTMSGTVGADNTVPSLTTFALLEAASTMADADSNRHRLAQLRSTDAKRARTVILACTVCEREFTVTADRALAKVCDNCRPSYRREQTWLLSKNRTREQRQAERRRAAASNGKRYLTSDNRSAERAERQAKQATERAARAAKRHTLTLTQRRERARARAKRYYEEHRSEKIAKANGYRVKARSSEAYRRMERECVKRWTAKNPDRVRVLHRKSKLARRARKASAFVEHVDPMVVFKRDSGICGICMKAVDQSSRWHIDHIIPLAKGGKHSYANVQLAHGRCNELKGDSLPTSRN